MTYTMPFKIKVPNTDAFFYDNIVDPISNYCSNIHPNWITLFGLPLSFIIYITHMFPPVSFILSYVVMMIRTLCDLLDGHTARKYNKETTLGACLDTIADAINAANFVTYAFFRLLGVSFITCVIVFIITIALIIYISFRTGILFDHSLIKQENSDLVGALFSIGKYNMVVQFTLLYIAIWFILI